MEKLNINAKLSKIQVELKAEKSKYNSFGKYKYRSAEDILEALKPFNVKYGVNFTIDEDFIEFGANGVIQTTASITDVDSGDHVSVNATVGVEKAGGMALPQAFGSASSYGKKYALGNLLLIDDTQDADASNGHGSDKAPKEKMTDEQFAQAKIFVQKGGSISAIKKKYKVSSKELKDLEG